MGSFGGPTARASGHLLIRPRDRDDRTLNLGEGFAVLVHPLTGLPYRLNATAVAIWDALRHPMRVSDLRSRLQTAFDVPSHQVDESIEAFVGQLWELGLVEVIDEADAATPLRQRYLDLLIRALVNLIYPEHELRLVDLHAAGAGGDALGRERRLRDIRYTQAEDFATLVAAKQTGMNWRRTVTRFSHTMVGVRRLEHLWWCAAQVFAEEVPGDFLEAGVCQGGASIFMRGLQVAYGQPERLLWIADSFQGLPVPSLEPDRDYDFSESRQPFLAFGMDAVRDNFRTYDLLSDEVRFLPGWFRDTLPEAPVGPLAILRIDADLYESTRDVLQALYDRVSPGGFVIVDDYHAFPPCRDAVDDFRKSRRIQAPMRRIDWSAVYWRTPRPSA